MTPGAKHELVKKKGEALIISVKEPAVGNRANMRVREVVAMHFGIFLQDVRIINGHHNHSKMLSVRM